MTDYGAQAAAEGAQAVEDQRRRDEALFGQALLNQQSLNRLVQAKASLVSALAFLIFMATASGVGVLVYLAFR